VSDTRDQKRFTTSEVAADWHELMIPQRSMRPSIARVSEQLDPRFAASTHTNRKRTANSLFKTSWQVKMMMMMMVMMNE